MIVFLRHLSVPVTLICVVSLSGCAFGTRQPTLTYPPEHDPNVVSAAHSSAIRDSKNQNIYLELFTDQRSDKKVVGTVRNGFGMRTADVIPANSVDEWVTSAVRTELHTNGYTVIEGLNDNSPANTKVSVSGEILNVFCDMYFSYTGQVSLIIRVNKAGKELFNKHYPGEGSAGIVVAATEDSYAQSLELALSAALNLFIADLEMNLNANQ